MFFILLGLVVFSIYWLTRPKHDQATSSDFFDELASQEAMRQNNDNWIRFIHGYQLVSKTKAEKDLLARMISDAVEQGSVSADFVESLDSPSASIQSADNAESAISSKASALGTAASLLGDSDIKPKDKADVQQDNTSLLLYFGAFLFIAASGLFVAFAGVSGGIRLLLVLLVIAVMYSVGQWIIRSKQALRPAGVAFIGIGVALAPLTGAAYYSFIDNSNAPLIWLVTSLFCLGLYIHAILTVRSSILDYVFIFTILSLFESVVSVMDFPIYYFGWAMAGVGLLLQGLSLSSKLFKDFRKVSKSGSQIYIPLSIMVSLFMVSQYGVGQLGVSLIIASIYYGLAFKTTLELRERTENVLASQITLIAGLTSLVYAMTNDLVSTGVFLALLSLAHIPVLMLVSSVGNIMNNFASVMLISSAVSLPIVVQSLNAFTAITFVIVMQSLYVWWRQKRTDAYVMASLAWLAFPYLLVEILSLDQWSYGWSTIIVAGLGLQAIFYLLIAMPRTMKLNKWITPLQAVLTLNLTVSTVAVLPIGPLASLVALTLISYIVWFLAWRDRSFVWPLLTGLSIGASLLSGWSDDILWLSMIVALIFNILLSLQFRSEANRWLSTGLWLVLPLGLGGFFSHESWVVSQYAWSYVLVTIGLVISRMFARGSVFLSDKVPLSAYAKNSSLSYTAGYLVSGSIAFMVSLYSNNTTLHTTLIAGVIGVLVLLLAWYVEKNLEILLALPLILQVMLLSGIRPVSSDFAMSAFIVSSIAVSSIGFWFSDYLNRGKIRLSKTKMIDEHLVLGFLATTYTAPLVFLFAGSTDIFMVIGLVIASLTTYYYIRQGSQDYRELSLSLTSVSLMWAMHLFGIREFQAYSHLVAITLAAFAWWRHHRGEIERSDQYIYWALAVATVPLIIQVFSGQAGDVYGWWLLIEQVMFMLIGIAINKKIVTRWGLYVALGSVLYQLRHLGYAALAVLALFVIGVAIYRLQKYGGSSDGKDK